MYLCLGRDDRRRIHYHLTVVNNTLVISSEGRWRRPPINVDKAALIAAQTKHLYSGYMGDDFERAFTTWPEGLEASGNHTRVLQYKLGDLNCVVTAGVDACFMTEADESDSPPSVQDIDLPEGPTSTGHILERYGVMKRFPTAEVKGHYSIEKAPYAACQLWFNRADFVIGGYLLYRVKDAIIQRIKIKKADDLRQEWEKVEENQHGLRQLASLLSQLRDIVNDTEHKHCYISRPPSDWAYPYTLDVHTIEDGTASTFEVDVRNYWQNDDQ